MVDDGMVGLALDRLVEIMRSKDLGNVDKKRYGGQSRCGCLWSVETMRRNSHWKIDLLHLREQRNRCLTSLHLIGRRGGTSKGLSGDAQQNAWQHFRRLFVWL